MHPVSQRHAVCAVADFFRHSGYISIYSRKDLFADCGPLARDASDSATAVGCGSEPRGSTTTNTEIAGRTTAGRPLRCRPRVASARMRVALFLFAATAPEQLVRNVDAGGGGGGGEGGGDAAGVCDDTAIDEVTAACCEPIELCADGVPTRCTDACASVFARFYRSCQPLLDEILVQSMPDHPQQYELLNAQCIERLATSAVAVDCEDDPRGGRRGCGSATIDRPATAQQSGHQSHCVWARVLQRCPATCSPQCSAPSTALQVGGASKLGQLASMENTWFHLDVTAGTVRAEFADGRVSGVPVLGDDDIRDPVARLSFFDTDGIVRCPHAGRGSASRVAVTSLTHNNTDRVHSFHELT
jgi:hypothetical protein